MRIQYNHQYHIHGICHTHTVALYVYTDSCIILHLYLSYSLGKIVHPRAGYFCMDKFILIAIMLYTASYISAHQVEVQCDLSVTLEHESSTSSDIDDSKSDRYD